MQPFIKILCLLVVFFLPLTLKAQDLPMLELGINPISITVYPNLGGKRPFNLSAKLGYNFTPHWGLSLEYRRFTVRDRFGTGIANDFNNQDPESGQIDFPQLLFRLDENIEYKIDVISLGLRYNFLPHTPFNPYFLIYGSYVKRQTEITSFDNDVFLFADPLDPALQTATKGYISSDPITVNDRDNATDIPFLEEEEIFSGGLGAGLEWNIKRWVSIHLQVSMPDLFNVLELTDTRNIIIVRFVPRPSSIAFLPSVVLPNEGQQEGFNQGIEDRNPRTFAYLSQTMDTPEKHPMLLAELGVTFKLLYKK